MIDSVRDHLIPHIVELKTAKEMFDALVGLFERKNTSTKLALRNQLCCIIMSKSNSIATSFMKVSQLRDQLQAIRDNVDDVEFVIVTLNGLLLYGSHLFRVFVNERSCHSLIEYKVIVSKKKSEYYPRTVCKNPGMKGLKHLQIIQGERK